MQDPLTVSLNDIVSLDGEEDKEFILRFNKQNKDMIRQDLEIKKINGQQELSRGYSHIEKYLANLPQKKKSKNSSWRKGTIVPFYSPKNMIQWIQDKNMIIVKWEKKYE